MPSVTRGFLFCFLLITSAMATEQAFPPTAPGVTEVKILPAGVLLKSAGRGNYFEQSDGLFMPLFRYISRHNIAMTTPVEARIDDAAMYFWVAESQHAKVAGNEGTVAVERIPKRRVASLGAKGSYSRGNFEKNRDTLVMTVVATVAGAISMLANFGMFFRSGDNRGHALATILAVIVAPMAAMIVQIDKDKLSAAETEAVVTEQKAQAAIAALYVPTPQASLAALNALAVATPVR